MAWPTGQSSGDLLDVTDGAPWERERKMDFLTYIIYIFKSSVRNLPVLSHLFALFGVMFGDRGAVQSRCRVQCEPRRAHTRGRQGARERVLERGRVETLAKVVY